jgi:hypothetical protein
MRTLSVAIATVSTAGLFMVGCLSDPTSVQNVFPKKSIVDSDVSLLPGGDTTSGGDTVTSEDVPAAPPCGCIPPAGSWYRFTGLTVTKLSGADQLVPDSLNLLWSKDIANHELNILFRLDGVTGGKMSLHAYSGARVPTEAGATPPPGGDAVCYIDSSHFEAGLPATTCQYGPTAGIALTVYSGTKTNPKNCVPGGLPPQTEVQSYHAIPVSEVNLAAVHTGVCDGTSADYLEGQLVGSIAKALLDTLCTCASDSSDGCGPPDEAYAGSGTGTCAGCASNYSSLHDLLMLLNNNKDVTYGCKTKDGSEAACIEATFKAEAMAASPAKCP